MQNVTAIICVRNAVRFVKEAVWSVCASPVRELVIYDDGSSDGSLQAAVGAWAHGTRRAADVPFLRVGSAPGRGIASARNQALLLARGDYIAFLDADDLWLPGKIEKQLLALDERRDALCVTLVEQFLDGVECPKSMRPETIGVPLRLPYTSTWLCHRSVFANVGGFDESLYSTDDVDWFRRAMRLGYERIDVEEVLVRKRIHGDNISMDPTRDPAEEIMRVLRKR